MVPTDAMTIATLTAERDHALRELDRWQTLAEQTAAALKGADAEIARLRTKAPEWWCFCDRLNRGGDACAACARAKPAPSGRHA
jgi:hypothetical protein